MTEANLDRANITNLRGGAGGNLGARNEND